MQAMRLATLVLVCGLVAAVTAQCEVFREDICPGAVRTKKLADGAVTEAKIADGAVTAAKLADGLLLRGPTGPPGAPGDAALTGDEVFTDSDNDVSHSEDCMLGNYLGTGPHCVWAACPDPANQVLIGGNCRCPVVEDDEIACKRRRALLGDDDVVSAMLGEEDVGSTGRKLQFANGGELFMSNVIQQGIRPWKKDSTTGKQLYRYICECSPNYFSSANNDNGINEDELDGEYGVGRRLNIVASGYLPGYDENWSAIASAYCIAK